MAFLFSTLAKVVLSLKGWIKNFSKVESKAALSATTHPALTQQGELKRLRSESIQNISYEMRTPLAIIRGYAELLDSGELDELQPEQQAVVSIITRRSRELTRLMDDLTAILETETQELKRESVNE